MKFLKRLLCDRFKRHRYKQASVAVSWAERTAGSSDPWLRLYRFTTAPAATRCGKNLTC